MNLNEFANYFTFFLYPFFGRDQQQVCCSLSIVPEAFSAGSSILDFASDQMPEVSNEMHAGGK